MYTIYDSPTDYPGKFVVRRWEIDKGPAVPKETLAVKDSLIEARLAVPVGLVRVDRSPGDDPVIVETWL